MGRQVCTGEKAIKILGYATKKITRTDPDNGEEVEDWLVRYPVLSVFGASQTEGAAPIPANPYRLPTGDGPDGALDQLTGWLESDGWTLRGLLLAGTCQGYTDNQRRLIATDTRLGPAARLAVLLHEAAHAVLHGDLEAGEYQAHRGTCETEAESTAYVLANLLGHDVDTSSISYIAGWSKADPTVLTTAAGAVTEVDLLGYTPGTHESRKRPYPISPYQRMQASKFGTCKHLPSAIDDA